MAYYKIVNEWGKGTIVHHKRVIVESDSIENAISEAEKVLGSLGNHYCEKCPEHKFKIGDHIIFTNDYGISWSGKTITELCAPFPDGIPRYRYTPDNTPWFSVSEKNLTIHANYKE